MELSRTTPPPTRHRLTATNVARYFKHSCDRLFRWEAVGGKERSNVRALEGVPDAHCNDSRPGIELLMAAGDAFEMEHVRALVATHGDAHVEPLQVAMDNGARRALIPIENKRSFFEVHADVLETVDPIFFGDLRTATTKALSLER